MESNMPKATKTRTKPWTDNLDPDAIQAALEDAVVDAYDDDEQHAGLLTMVENELKFPFRARVLGEEVVVVGFEWPERDEFGLDLLCERKGVQQRVEARSVELLKPYPAGHLYLAAYLEWKRRY
jgi:hypothetical protein